MVSKKVLVTGATGFIGSHVIDSLIEKGFEVHALGHGQHNSILEPYRPLYKTTEEYWYYGDLLDTKSVGPLMELVKPEYLLHLAWDVRIGYQENINNIDWMNASLNLVHQFSNVGGRVAILAGTCLDHNPTTTYGVCKRSMWNILQYARYADSLSLGYGRIYYLYGPNEKRTRLIPKIINGFLNNGEISLEGCAEQRLYLSYVQDVANKLVQALDYGLPGEFDICSEQPVSIRTIATTVAGILDMNPNIVYGTGYSDLKDPYNLLNLKIGFTNDTSLVRGLTKTINWWKDQKGK